MAKGKNVLTTGDVAKICNVAPRTVSKWFDNGQLKGYRIPGSKDRRIPVSELVRFMKMHNMPTLEFPFGKIRVLIVDMNTEETTILASTLEENTNYDVRIVHSTFETGLVIQKFTPHVILINIMDGNTDVEDICKSIRTSDELQAVKIIAMANSISNPESTTLLKKGFDGYISNPYDAKDVIRQIEQTTTIVY